MKVAKWGNSLGIRIPADVAKALELIDGDDVSVTIEGARQFSIAREKMSAEEAMRRIRALARPLPPGWKFNREEANERRP